MDNENLNLNTENLSPEEIEARAKAALQQEGSEEFGPVKEAEAAKDQPKPNGIDFTDPVKQKQEEEEARKQNEEDFQKNQTN